jgi:Tol biopolymer transport system component
MKRIKALCAILLLVSTCIPSLFCQDLFPVRRLTFENSQDAFPSWSPQGNLLVYSRMDWTDSTNTGLWCVSPSTGASFQLINALAEHPHWSPDGNYILFDADTGNNIKLVASSGGWPIHILPDSLHIRRGGTPCWSPDGSHFAFREEYKLYIQDIRTGQVKCIFHHAGYLPIPCCWSRDGSSVITTLRHESNYESSVIAVSVDSPTIKELAGQKDMFYRYSDLSPDGSLLVYTSKESGKHHFWVMPARGGKGIQITSGPSSDDGPRWSPDGSSIAFVSARSGNADIWVMDLDLPALKRKVELLNAAD